MIGKTSTTDALKQHAVSGKELAAQLARDRKFRKQIVAAATHGAAARRRARSRLGLAAAFSRLATDGKLRKELRDMSEELRHAWSRVESKRSHKLRTSMLVLAGAGIVAVAAPRLKELLADGDHGTGDPGQA
jgi:hypothetical protein